MTARRRRNLFHRMWWRVFCLRRQRVIPDDPLADCLGQFVALTHRPVSVASLLAGLPLEAGRLTPADGARTGARGLCREDRTPALSRIKAIFLPVILFLKDGDACILISRPGRQMADCRPPHRKKPDGDAREALESDYAGAMLLARRDAAAAAATRPAAEWPAATGSGRR
jgi:ATP-binding cassette, subfamily C, bacterial LapB